MAIDGVGLPFPEAIDLFGAKVNLPTQRWDDLRHGAHVRAFSVAGVMRDDMLADFRAAIDRAIREGTGFEDFRATFDRIVDATGWQFNARGATEEERRAWRARVIYSTNMRTAYMAAATSRCAIRTCSRTAPSGPTSTTTCASRACSISHGTGWCSPPTIPPGT